MSDSFTTTTSTSWAKRLTSALAGVLIGLALFAGSFTLLTWNEGRSIARYKTLDEGRSLVVSASADSLDASKNGKLIHVSGFTKSPYIVQDPVFGTSADALKLRRTVEMYQWEEDEETNNTKNAGGSETTETTYSYKKTWSSELIHSDSFQKPEGHQNPDTMPYHSQTLEAQDITLGQYKLGHEITQEIDNYEEFPLSQTEYDQMDPQLQQAFKLHMNQLFYGNPDNPQIGAMRVTYDIIRPGDYSVIGAQNSNNIGEFLTKHGSIALAEPGILESDVMFQIAEDENTIMTWLLRVGGFVMMWLGLTLVLKPISAFGDIIPFVGSVLQVGIGALTFITSAVLSIVTIAVAWLFLRPLISIPLLLLALFMVFGGWKVLHKKARGLIKTTDKDDLDNPSETTGANI